MPRDWPWIRLRALLALILGVFALSLVVFNSNGSDLSLQTTLTTSKNFSWIDIKPTRKLVWYPCHEQLKRECARLLVPLNHSNPDPDGPTAAIALVRKPSSISPSSPLYRGPVLFNPGGPGGSGVDLIMSAADLFSAILGPEFDIVGFDPRGIARSTPKANFFPNVGEREMFGGDGLGVISEDAKTGGRSVESVWARARLRGKLAGERMGETLAFLNTEQTAGDMLSITRAFGKEKLLYWGFSYGTVLGATFAALYPDKIERLILDGVEDSENYYATLWSTNLLDTDKTLSQFFTSCHAAGPEGCAFWASSPDDIKQNFTHIYTSLQNNPIPIRADGSYGILDYSRLRGIVFSALYSPYRTWPMLARGLAELGGRGDPQLLYSLTAAPPFTCPCTRDSDCGGKEQREREMEKSLADAGTAILCGDGKDVPGDTEAAKKYFEMLSKESQWGELWANIRLSCSGWPKAKKPFQGPFEANTSFPILLIGNTADPVTPLAGAKTMSKGFAGSVVLTQDSPGHCSINAPSVCTQAYIRDYFANGNMPPEGTVCPVIMPPFPGIPEAEPVVQGTEDVNEAVFEDLQFRNAVDELSKMWKPFNRGFLW